MIILEVAKLPFDESGSPPRTVRGASHEFVTATRVRFYDGETVHEIQPYARQSSGTEIPKKEIA